MNTYARQGDTAAAQVMQAKLQQVRPVLAGRANVSGLLTAPLPWPVAGRPLQLFTANKVHPLKSLAVPLAQMPIFVSYFMAMRAMAAAPVASMQTEGARG